MARGVGTEEGGPGEAVRQFGIFLFESSLIADCSLCPFPVMVSQIVVSCSTLDGADSMTSSGLANSDFDVWTVADANEEEGETEEKSEPPLGTRDAFPLADLGRSFESPDLFGLLENGSREGHGTSRWASRGTLWTPMSSSPLRLTSIST